MKGDSGVCGATHIRKDTTFTYMKLKKLILPALALTIAAPAWGVRALNEFVEIVQPDGTVISVKKCGDEFSHFVISTDGALLAEKDGAYYFGKLESNGFISSTGILAANPENRNAAQQQAVTLMTSENIQLLNQQRMNGPMRTLPQSGMGRFTSNFPRTGDIRGLVILVSYSDVPFTLSDPHGYFDGLLNTDGFSEYSATGCAAEYFRYNSDNQFRPVFDVLGPVQLPQSRSYYGGNDYAGNDRNPEDMVVHAIQQLDDEHDFSVYDMDGDGKLDNVFIIYAGQGEASYGSSSTVWPHSWRLSAAGKSFVVDGVTVDTYGCTNEWEYQRPDGVGTFIHEFSHVMGLPDLYSTNYGNSVDATPGLWSVLDYGPYNNNGCTPPNYSSFERLAMGWIEPEILDGPNTVSLPNLAETNKAYMINTNKTTEYFLFENRQQEGWDKYLPGHGMLIWHVDFVQSVWDQNAVNNQKSHMYVELKKASNVIDAPYQSKSIYAGWSWPGTYHKTEFTDDTTPSMRTWRNTALGLPITGITEENGLIKFDVAGGKALIDSPIGVVPVNGGEDWFEATWEPVENAIDYFLTVSQTINTGEDMTYTNDMGSGTTLSLPEGWTSSSTSVYSTNTNFGNAAPSYKMSTDNASITSPVYDSDIVKVSFWQKGMQADNGSNLVVTGREATGSEVNLATIIPNKSSARIEELTDIPTGIRQIVFTYKKMTGNMAIDDIEITTGGSQTSVLEGYDHISTNGETKFNVQHPVNPEVVYSYTVEATDGENISKPSDRVSVPDAADLNNNNNSVDSVSALDGFRMAGRTLVASQAIEVIDLSGRVIFSGTGIYTLPEAGAYIVRQNNKASKLMVK